MKPRVRNPIERITLNNIPRVKLSSIRDFRKEYVLKSRPVIITDLYKNQPIASISSLESAQDHFGDVKIRINRNYAESLLSLPKQYECTFKEYFDLMQEDPSLDLMCTEDPTPDEITRLFKVPSISRGIRDVSPLSHMHIGYAGATAPLHFDWDCRQVLLTQVFGKKRILLISPLFSKRLNPCGHFSGINVRELSDDEKLNFIRYNEGYDCILNPGETLYMPMLWWHCVEYLDAAMTFSIRFATNIYTPLIAALPPHYYLQNIASNILDNRRNGLRYLEHFFSIIRAYYIRHSNPYVRYQKMMSIYQSIYKAICPNSLQGNYLSPYFDIEERAMRHRKALRGKDYAPRFLLSGRGDNPLSPRYEAIIKKGMRFVPEVEKIVRAIRKKRMLRDLSELEIIALINCSWLFPDKPLRK